ncbi:MAG: zf-HC2 domain-containing protein [Acidobacteriaceae bacterium]|nr:zf-HC2 domain-containing protein [Acidobacteriaceae bacterium]
MNCVEFESILADYIDGTLAASQRAAVDQHAETCPACREFMADVAGAIGVLQRMPQVEPPAELITRIAYQAPVGRVRHPAEHRSFLSRLAAKWLQPILQPRIAMGMAMTLLSFAMLERCTGIRVQHIQAADLSPVRIWDGVEDKALRVRDRVMKSYENLRVVYEVETRLNDLQEQQEAADQQALRRSRSAQRPQQGGSNNANKNPGGTRSPGTKQGDKK